MEKIKELKYKIALTNNPEQARALYKKLKAMKYQQEKEQARREAINFQYDLSINNCSYLSLFQHQQRFTKLAKRYGLIKEFKENGII